MTPSARTTRDAAVLEHIRRRAIPLHAGDAAATLSRFVGDARFVLLGEASHGTHEFYSERAAITRRLIEEKRLDAVAVEADWPDAARVDRYVRGLGADRSAEQALRGFERFPGWMWRNEEVAGFVEWLREYNSEHPAAMVGFFGLDLYSLFKSIDAVVDYLDRNDPVAAKRARADYACFDHCARDTQRYAYETAFGMSASCEREVLAQLRELQGRREAGDGIHDKFYAEQNARLVKNAEEYYRTMFRGRVSSWNLRDRHMAETLDELALYLGRQHDRLVRIAVWEHNSHIGDARATEIGRSGEWNVGQLVREAYGDDAVLIGFTTSEGHVMAASAWNGQHEIKVVRPALPDSYEALFHHSGVPAFFLSLRDDTAEMLREERLERAIGVIYLPQTERQSHYFYASLPQQFDAVLHFDKTTAVTPLDRREHAGADKEAPETFPTGI